MDDVDGIVVGYLVVEGNPADAPMLAPAVARVKARFGKAPKAVTADRGTAPRWPLNGDETADRHLLFRGQVVG